MMIVLDIYNLNELLGINYQKNERTTFTAFTGLV